MNKDEISTSLKAARFIFITLISIGLFTNILNIIVYTRNPKRMLKQAPTFPRIRLYLSIVDLAILTVTGGETLIEYAFDIDIRVYASLFCKFDTFLTYFLTQSRNVLTMGMTVHSAIVVCNLLNEYKNSHASKRKHSSLVEIMRRSTNILTTSLTHSNRLRITRENQIQIKRLEKIGKT